MPKLDPRKRKKKRKKKKKKTTVVLLVEEKIDKQLGQGRIVDGVMAARKHKF